MCKSSKVRLFLQSDEAEFALESSRTSVEIGAASPAETAGASNIARKTISSATKFFRSISENTGLIPHKHVHGGDSMEEGAEYASIKTYYIHLEAHLNEVYQQAERLTRQHMRMAKSLSEFGHCMATLSSKIEPKDESNAAYCSMLGERSIVASHGWDQSGKEMHVRFEEPLKEFLRSVRSAKQTIEDRDELLVARRQTKADLESRRARLAKLQSTPGMRQDRIMEAERELQAALIASQQATTSYEEAVKRMDADIVRFQRERSQELRHILMHFAQIQADHGNISSKAWNVPQLGTTTNAS